MEGWSNTKIYLNIVDSTNNFARQNIKDLKHGTAVFAEVQTGGKGRFNRVWYSGLPGNIFLSIVLKPEGRENAFISCLTQYASVKTAKVLQNYGVKPEIKWPNDVLVEGKKIAGILAETCEDSGKTAVILGIGINLNCTEDFIANIPKPAASLNLILGHKINRDTFLDEFLKEFFSGYENFTKNSFTSIKKDYLALVAFLGQEVEIHTGKKQLKGFAQGLTDEGFLIFRTPNGENMRLTAGEIIN